MLRAQRAYGQSPVQADERSISIGRALYPVLPEDIFDRAPQRRGPFIFVADARIDNRPELGLRLGLNAAELATRCDSELLFDALLCWGEDAPDKVVGEFAFALWNAEKRALLLGRDILGYRPLYLHRSRDFIAFASMPSGLHALADIPKEVDTDFVAERLALLPQVGPDTYFRHIERVEPAHLLRVQAERSESERYWHPRRPDGASASPAEREEHLRTLFGEAVRSQLRGAGPAVGTHLSGGLDSATVTATAAIEIASGQVVAFTSVPHRAFEGQAPPGMIADERAQAATLARAYPNIEHVIVEGTLASPLDGLDREHFYQQQPIANLCNAIWGRGINRIAHQRRLKVLLIGNSGNMSISYAGLEWLSHLVKRGRLLSALRLAAALARDGMPLHSLGAQLIGPLIPTRAWARILQSTGRSNYLSNYSGLAPEALRSVSEKAAQRAVDLTYRPFSDAFDLRLQVLTHSDGGNYFKGILGEWGLSIRDPTADKRVLEYCLSVPAAEFTRGGTPRSLARRAFADRLPSLIRTSNRRGYQSADWYETIAANLPAVRAEIAAITRNPASGEAIDLSWLGATAESFPSRGPAMPDVTMRYRYGLLRAVSAGHFMRKVAGTN